MIFGSVFGGKERELNRTRPDLGREYLGARLGGQLSFSDKLNMYSSVNYQHSLYGGDDPLFFIRRRDHLYGVDLGINYQPIKGLVVTPQFNYSKNESSIQLNGYDRWQAYITLRKNL